MITDAVLLADSTRGDDGQGYPRPPSLHWGLVLLFWIVTGGIFGVIWIFRQAAWVRRIDPSSQALRVLAVAFPCTAIVPVMAGVSGAGSGSLFLTIVIVRLGFAAVWIWSYLSMRQSIEARFDLNLSGFLTVLLPVFYLQYHMTRIANGEHLPDRHGLLFGPGFR